MIFTCTWCYTKWSSLALDATPDDLHLQAKSKEKSTLSSCAAFGYGSCGGWMIRKAACWRSRAKNSVNVCTEPELGKEARFETQKHCKNQCFLICSSDFPRKTHVFQLGDSVTALWRQHHFFKTRLSASAVLTPAGCFCNLVFWFAKADMFIPTLALN